ncbi:hypothetical protein Tco_1538708 [Tanacetum coccineum]
MSIEFVVLLNEMTFPVSQVILEVYNEEAFVDNREIYIVSSEGYRYKVELVNPDEGRWYLTGDRWTEFCNRRLNVDVSLLHFVEEGDDCFYNMYVLSIDTWNLLVDTLGLESGSVCVFTRNKGKRLWLDSFNNDGSALTEVFFKGAASLRRVQQPLTASEQYDDRMRHVCFWPFHMDHFGEMPMTFYKSFSKIVHQNRLTIPANFVDFHHMHTYQKGRSLPTQEYHGINGS